MEPPLFEDSFSVRAPQNRQALLPALWQVQEADHHINPAAVTEISRSLRIPEAEIYGVIAFYSMFDAEPTAETIIEVCTGPVCRVMGAENTIQHLCHELHTVPGQPDPAGAHLVRRTTCLGLCEHAPAALVRKRGAGQRQCAHVHTMGALLDSQNGMPAAVVGGENLRLLERAAAERPESLAEYGDYAALRRALFELPPEQVIAEVEAAGLTGRGGAAFPVGAKWRYTRAADSPTRYVVCNADESEPGTFKDRVLMELRPHLVLEGMALCAYAIGARQGYIFIRGEYPEAAQRLADALEAAQNAGVIGDHILGSDFCFHVEIRRGAGAYICGEETALFEAIEGRRGFPRIKPPFPTSHGLFGQPTAINNVETLAMVPLVVAHGAAWFRELGTPDSAGSKLVSVSGHVHRPGVVEIPFGTPLRRLIEDHCGGVIGDLQAILMGGAAGTFLAPDEIDVPLSFEGLRAIGATLGSGAIMVFNHTVDLRDVLSSLAEFFKHESCGKCYPCQLGTQRQFEIISRLDHPLPGDRERLRDVGLTMREASLCGLGQTASMAVLSALEKWPKMFAASVPD